MPEITFSSSAEKTRVMENLRESLRKDRDKQAVLGRRIERKIERLKEFDDAPIV